MICTIIFYCVQITTNLLAYHPHLLSHCFVGQMSEWAQRGSLLRVCKLSSNQVVNQPGFLSGSPGKESDSRLIKIIGRIHFFME